jgi:DNA ligase-1
LTDEELARKLQAEWDQEDVGRDEAADVEARESNAGQESNVAEAPPESGKVSRTEGISDGNDGNNQSSGGEPKQVNPMASTATKNNNTLSLQAAGSAEDTITSNIPFDESPLTFDPAKYIADLQGHWATEGGNASYALLTRCFVLVNSTQSRIKIVDTLVNLLRVLIEGDPSSLLPTVRINKLPSSFES